jgi:hypothetical protein
MFVLHNDKPTAGRASNFDVFNDRTFDKLHSSRFRNVFRKHVQVEGDKANANDYSNCDNELCVSQGTLTFAAVFLPVFAIFGGLLILVKDTPRFWQYVFEGSYVKHGLKIRSFD